MFLSLIKILNAEEVSFKKGDVCYLLGRDENGKCLISKTPLPFGGQYISECNIEYLKD